MHYMIYFTYFYYIGIYGYIYLLNYPMYVEKELMPYPSLMSFILLT